MADVRVSLAHRPFEPNNNRTWMRVLSSAVFAFYYFFRVFDFDDLRSWLINRITVMIAGNAPISSASFDGEDFAITIPLYV